VGGCFWGPSSVRAPHPQGARRERFVCRLCPGGHSPQKSPPGPWAESSWPGEMTSSPSATGSPDARGSGIVEAETYRCTFHGATDPQFACLGHDLTRSRVRRARDGETVSRKLSMSNGIIDNIQRATASLSGTTAPAAMSSPAFQRYDVASQERLAEELRRRSSHAALKRMAGAASAHNATGRIVHGNMAYPVKVLPNGPNTPHLLYHRGRPRDLPQFDAPAGSDQTSVAPEAPLIYGAPLAPKGWAGGWPAADGGAPELRGDVEKRGEHGMGSSVRAQRQQSVWALVRRLQRDNERLNDQVKALHERAALHRMQARPRRHCRRRRRRRRRAPRRERRRAHPPHAARPSAAAPAARDAAGRGTGGACARHDLAGGGRGGRGGLRPRGRGAGERRGAARGGRRRRHRRPRRRLHAGARPRRPRRAGL